MISTTIILLVQQLGLTVMTEGVENIEQLNILESLKCDKAQGYYFSEPISKDEIENMIK
ncbi:EAL domain-containing protein [Tissierella sp. MSJ-40]|uniref:EAL domain-containing protein n=1 Tax=Tissierella simiarum TaxID=2841534 RepID=A0ABS6E783_9FIRM|nr:EAL domain-containing protein [Tissierella simiarum]